jgi:Spx/MgsR family transcriptional regulator
MIKIYGIKNCDSVKRAMKWFDHHNIDYHFHDLRLDGLSEQELHLWMKELGWKTLINQRGTTWRDLPNNEKSGMDNEKACALILKNVTLIKRPLLDLGNNYHVGFKEDDYKNLFSAVIYD